MSMVALAKAWNVIRAVAAIAVLLPGSVSAADEAPRVKIAQGVLEGRRESASNAFLGIPCAQPPVGDARWRSPRPAQGWGGVRAVTQFGASCWQTWVPGGRPPWTREYMPQTAPDEDCLTLKVWTPHQRAAGKPLSMLLWIHGGGYTEGGTSVPIYDGAALAAQGIIVVTVNYRLGILGFLAHPELTREAAGAEPTANYGLQDVILALQWVRANAAAFGGDPARVTIAGQSAGSSLVHDLIVSPRAKGLFAQAIVQSSSPNMQGIPTLAEAEARGAAFAASQGAADLAALRAMRPQQLRDATAKGQSFPPIADGLVLPDAPAALYAGGRFADVPMMGGITNDEASGFSRTYGSDDEATFNALLKGIGDERLTAFYAAETPQARAQMSRQIARDRGAANFLAWARSRAVHAKRPLYAYLFHHPDPGPDSARYGAFHSSELPYLFATLDTAPARGFSAADRALAAQMSRTWSTFVRTGNPNGADLPRWPAFDGRTVLQLDTTSTPAALLPADKDATFSALIAACGRLSLF